MPKIAGSIPPLAESYRADLVGSFETNVLQYRVIVSSLINYVDLFLCETMSTINESKSAVVAAIETMKGKFYGLKYWTQNTECNLYYVA